MLYRSFSINLKLFRPIIFVFAYKKTLLVRILILGSFSFEIQTFVWICSIRHELKITLT